MRIFAILIIAALGGCRDYEKSYSPDGEREFRLKCNYPDCDIEAGKLCKKRGYEIADRRDEAGNVVIRCGR